MIAISYIDLGLGSLLLLLHASISLWYRTGVAVSVLVAGARMVVQLALMAYVLQLLFHSQNPWWTVLAGVVMIAFAGREIVARQKVKLSGSWAYAIGTGSLFMAASLALMFGLFAQVQPDPWYDARYFIPLLGMILGNAMTGVSIGLSTLVHQMKQQQDVIEARLALGHTKWQACETIIRDALHTGMIGIVNSMSAAGLVFIPGMMTGQLMAGADPMEAAKYQALIMFLIAGATALGTTLSVFLTVFYLTDHRHRLRLERLA